MSLQIKSQNRGGESHLSTEEVALVYFNNYNINWEINSSSTFYSYLFEDKKNDAPDTHAHMMNLYQKLTNETIIKANGSTAW